MPAAVYEERICFLQEELSAFLYFHSSMEQSIFNLSENLKEGLGEHCSLFEINELSGKPKKTRFVEIFKMESWEVFTSFEITGVDFLRYKAKHDRKAFQHRMANFSNYYIAAIVLKNSC